MRSRSICTLTLTLQIVVSSIRKSVTSGYRIVLNSPLLSPNLQPQRIKYGKKASNPSEEDREQSDLPVAAVPRSRMKVSAKKESAEIKHATVVSSCGSLVLLLVFESICRSAFPLLEMVKNPGMGKTNAQCCR